MIRARVACAVFLFAGCAAGPSGDDGPRRFREALDEGDRRLSAGDAAGAAGAYSRAVDLDPGSALAWFRRGEAESAAGDEAGASRDFSTAIRLNLNDALPWFHRAKARQAQGDYAGAIDDFTHALGLRTAGEFLRGRGHARFCAGDLDGAIADLSEAARLQASGAGLTYTQLELAAARIRNGRRDDALAGLRRYFGHARGDAWTCQIADFLEGEMSEAEFLLTARSADGATRRERSCEAAFYAGIVRASAGDEDGAADLFRECLEGAVPGFVEPDMAKAELGRLRK